MKNFEELVVWQEAIKLAKTIYLITRSFPKEEQFGLTSQIRRATVSISSNIAEGFGRFGAKDKERFYIIALGSLLEVRSQLYVAKEVGFITQSEVEKLIQQTVELHKLLNALVAVQRKRK